uniref:Putative serine/threonine protein kinase n=1 Tax=Pithovirus LCDPAC02 TaxID=2506601 RepID=A0A481YQB9_9VIRU|nr:MAG: putative serine/threonine protein kinase [Pithovirus LCDPAC02]
MEYPGSFKGIKIIKKTNLSSIIKCNYRNKKVAVKIINKDHCHLSLVELYLMSTLSSDYIQSSIDISFLNDLAYVVQDLAISDLSSFKVNIEDFELFNKEMSYQCLKGLYYLHRNNIIHGDIKIDNVLVFPSNKKFKYVMKLCDFGFSRFISDTKIKNVYTSYYKPPEILIKDGATKKSDIWSMTIVFLRKSGYLIIKNSSNESLKNDNQTIIDLDHISKQLNLTFDIPNDLKNKLNKLNIEKYLSDIYIEKIEDWIDKDIYIYDIVFYELLIFKMLTYNIYDRCYSSELLCSPYFDYKLERIRYKELLSNEIEQNILKKFKKFLKDKILEDNKEIEKHIKSFLYSINLSDTNNKNNIFSTFLKYFDF